MLNRDYYANFFFAAKYGDARALSSLIEKKCDPNSLNSRGETPIMEAAYWGQPECVKILIEAKSELNKKDNIDGKSALLWAVGRKQTKNIKLLLKAGAEFDLVDNRLYTALDRAIACVDFNSINLLLSAGAMPKNAHVFLSFLQGTAFLDSTTITRTFNLFLYQQYTLRKNKKTVDKDLLLDDKHYKKPTQHPLDTTLLHNMVDMEKKLSSILNKTELLPNVLTDIVVSYDNPTQRIRLGKF